MSSSKKRVFVSQVRVVSEDPKDMTVAFVYSDDKAKEPNTLHVKGVIKPDIQFVKPLSQFSDADRKKIEEALAIIHGNVMTMFDEQPEDKVNELLAMSERGKKTKEDTSRRAGSFVQRGNRRGAAPTRK